MRQSFATQAIAFSDYVSIRSNFVETAPLNVRSFGGRLVTTNPLLPTQNLISFTNFVDGGNYFGKDSEEYARMVQYFSFISKTYASPQLISFVRWTDVDTAPLIYGVQGVYSVSMFSPYDNGAISLTIGGVTHVLTGIDFTSALSLADVAAAIQVAVRAADVSLQWADALVLYDSVGKQFDFIGGATGTASISAALAGTGTEILNLIGWGANAIFSNGDVTTSITDTLNASTGASNNFGSFTFIPTLTTDQHVEAANWVDGWSLNNSSIFIYHAVAPLGSYTTLVIALAPLDSDQITLTIQSPTSGQYDEEIPMALQGATDYTVNNGVQNYSYVSQDGLDASVDNSALKATLDAAYVNYYGVTQQAGDYKAWYQNGVILNVAPSPLGINVVANEAWLKDAIATALVNYLLVANNVPPNNQGRSQILAIIQQIILQAKANGTILPGFVLSPADIEFVTNISGDPRAFFQVQSIGYWLNAVVIFPPSVSPQLNYKLIYPGNQQILRVTGDHFIL